jgi:hypothetical protein
MEAGPPCPSTCSDLGAQCGVVFDPRCFTKIDCGGCANGDICGLTVANVCAPAPVFPDAAAPPIVVADNQYGPTYIAVDAENVYWTNTGQTGTGSVGFPGPAMMKRAIAGGVPTLLAQFNSGSSGATGLFVYGGRVYWTASRPGASDAGAPTTDGYVMGMPVTGGAPSLEWFQPASGALAGPVVDSTGIYWSGTDSGAVFGLAWDHSFHTLATGEQRPGGLALDSNNLYWETQQAIRSLPKLPPVGHPIPQPGDAGGMATTLGTMPPSPPIPGISSAIAVDAFGVYSNPFFPPLCVAWRTPLTGGGSQPLGKPNAPCAPIPVGGRGVATDGSNVYWTVPVTAGPVSSSGEIRKAPVTGGPLVTVASGQGFPWSVAVDARFVYWTNHGGINGGPGQVMMAPK